MTYLNCKKVIENKRKFLVEEEWAAFSSDMQDKLDVFLLNSRLSEEQYSELVGLLK